MAKARVLCIDDEESPRESLRFILKDRYDVSSKTDGASGLEAVRTEGPFDVVLLDMKMPDMSGLDVLSKILQLQPAMPVVMVTAIPKAKPAVQAMKMGAADYLNKPFDVDEIRLVVERVLREKALEKEVGRLRTELQTSYKFESIVGAGDSFHTLILANIEPVMVRHAPVVLEGLVAVGLFVETGHRNVADFEQFRCGEEHHVGGVVVKGVDHASLFDEHGLDTAPLEFDAARESGWPRADDDCVIGFGGWRGWHETSLQRP